MALLLTLIGVLVALAAQGALVLFLLNLGPLGIDHGEPINVVAALAINISLLLFFGAPHSLMARPRFKQWWTQLVSHKAERGVYMLMSGETTAAAPDANGSALSAAPSPAPWLSPRVFFFGALFPDILPPVATHMSIRSSARAESFR